MSDYLFRLMSSLSALLFRRPIGLWSTSRSTTVVLRDSSCVTLPLPYERVLTCYLSQIKGGPILDHATVDVSDHLREGGKLVHPSDSIHWLTQKLAENVFQLLKWRMDQLPQDFTISTRLFRCYDEDWLRRRVERNADLDKTFELYKAREKQHASSVVSLMDPTTGARIVNPVRGEDCDHLEVSRSSCPYLCIH